MFAQTTAFRTNAKMPLSMGDHRRGSCPWPHSSRSCTVLVVEYRDEVASRLVADLTALGMYVERAACATGVSRRCASLEPDLLLANVDLPDGSGWLLTAKLRLVSPTLPVWLYAASPSPNDVAFAEFVQSDDLIDYGGNVWKLSSEIASRLWDLLAVCAPAGTAASFM